MSAPPPAPFSSNPVLPHDTHPTMRRLARAARGTDPQVLGKALRAWPTQTRVFFDLDTVAPDGRTYRDHLELRDTPAVRQWALEHTLPPARPQAGPGVRL